MDSAPIICWNDMEGLSRREDQRREEKMSDGGKIGQEGGVSM